MDHTQYTTNGAERKPGTHLTIEDRGAIQAMKKLGYSNRAIARYLHCAPSTISNELKRGTPPRTGSRGRAPGYGAKRGDAVYKENRKNSHKPHRIDKCTSLILPIDGASFLDLLLLDRAVDALCQVCGYDDEIQEDLNQFLFVGHHRVFGLVHPFSPPEGGWGFAVRPAFYLHGKNVNPLREV